MINGRLWGRLFNSKRDTILLSAPVKDHRAKNYSWVTNLVLIFLCLGSTPLAAQNSMIFGNPVIFPSLRGKGFVITTSVSQTATTSTVTYTVTPPPNYIYNATTTVGQLNLQLLLPAGSETSVQFTISYTGWANVIGNPVGSVLAGGYSFGASPQTQTVTVQPGAGSLSFYLSGSSFSNPQPLPPSSITVTANLGNPQGGRKAYLNDYTGAGKTNYAVWRPSEGNWYILPITQPEAVTQWGLPGDVPVPGDYDGDGITDYAVWRPSNGNWYIIYSSTGAQIVQQWGFPGDIPIPGDFDGDGKTDYAVWRPSEGNWYISYSSGGLAVRQWGLSGDIPNGRILTSAPALGVSESAMEGADLSQTALRPNTIKAP